MMKVPSPTEATSGGMSAAVVVRGPATAAGGLVTGKTYQAGRRLELLPCIIPTATRSVALSYAIDSRCSVGAPVANFVFGPTVPSIPIVANQTSAMSGVAGLP